MQGAPGGNMDDHLKAAAEAATMTDVALLRMARAIREGKPLTCLEQAILDEIRIRKLKMG